MGTNCHEPEDAFRKGEVGDFGNDKAGAAPFRVPFTSAGAVAEVEATRLTDTLVEILKSRDDRFDLVAYPVVVADEVIPVDGRLPERGLGQSGNDGGFRKQLVRGGVTASGGGMDHAHGILDGDGLRAAFLFIKLAPPEAGKDKGLLSMDKVASIELGGHVGGEETFAEGVLGEYAVRGGAGEISPHGEKDPAIAIRHGLDRTHGVDAVLERRLE